MVRAAAQGAERVGAAERRCAASRPVPIRGR